MTAGRIALGVEYDGAAFHGWQTQSGPATVQATLEAALARINAAPVSTQAAGRTDAGVHATGQVAAFATNAKRPMKAWVEGVNSHLPATVGVRWAREMAGEFHPRYSATARRYQYLLSDEPVPPVLRSQVTYVRNVINADLLHREAQALVGEHDFTSFRAAGCQSVSPFRRVNAIRVLRFGPFVVLDIEANAFLLHMVRNIAGALIERARDGADAASILAARDRRAAGRTAPPNGLYLVSVNYPQFDLPKGRPAPLLRGIGDLDTL